MSQLTIRAPEQLVARLRSTAAANGQSMNELVVLVLDAATDPSLAGDPAARIRERLMTAGLMPAVAGRRGIRPPADTVAAARRRAGRGTSLSDLLAADR